MVASKDNDEIDDLDEIDGRARQSRLIPSDLRVPSQAFTGGLTVRSYEVGRAGGVRPGTILRYLEHLATRASAALGFDNRWYRDHNSAWVVREMALLLGVAPTIDDELRLATWVSDFRRVQATREYLITCANSGRLVARASARWAYIDRTRLTPIRIPDAICEPMGPWGYPMRPRAVAPLPAAAPLASELRLTAREYEADSQQHINNCVYLDWFDEAAQHAAAAGALTDQPVRLRPRFYHLEYMRPAQPGDALSVAITAPLRQRSRSLAFWQTISAESGLVARAWTEILTQASQ